MENFHYYTPTRVVFGKGTELQTGQLVKECGCKKVLVHYGSGSVKKSGLLDRICAALEEAEVDFVTLGGVVPNPRLSLVYEGIRLCREESVDFILAVGGGSVIDSAKAIGYGMANEGDVWDFYAKKRAPQGCLPLGVVLTIAAAGSEMSDSSVITKEEGWVKRGECLIRTVMKNAKILLENPKDYEARAEVMWAGSLSHNGLTGCGTDGGDWASHQLEHELGGMYDVAHGAGLSAVWGSWARYVMDARPKRFARFAVQVMGVEDTQNAMETAEKGVQAMEEFYRSIEMPTSLEELGVHPTEEEVRELARKCSFDGGRTIGCVKKLDQEDIFRIYMNAR